MSAGASDGYFGEPKMSAGAFDGCFGKPETLPEAFDRHFGERKTSSGHPGGLFGERERGRVGSTLEYLLLTLVFDEQQQAHRFHQRSSRHAVRPELARRRCRP